MDKRKRRLLCMLEGSGRKNRWISGVPPLQYSAKKQGTLKNYRIYGNTVGGESVGDLVESGEHAGEYKVPVTVEGKNLFDENSLISPISNFTWYFDDEHYLLATNTSLDNRTWLYSQSQFFIALSAGTYTLRLSGVGATSQYSGIRVLESNNNIIYSENIARKANIVITFTLNTPETIGIEIKLYDGKYRFMLNEGTTPLPYEPYHAPVTVPIYLPEQIRKVGDEAEYISYAEQKMHRIGADDIDVTLPALPTLPGTNVLSVGTAVQPSRVEVKGRIKAVG